MQITFTREQEDLRAVLRGFLAENSDVRALIDGEGGHDPHLWRRMAGEIGVQGLAIPERYGGAGGTSAELCVVFEELGRTLAGGAMLGTIGMAVPALLASGTGGLQAELLSGIADGSLVAAVAVAESDGSWDLPRPATKACPATGSFLLEGAKYFVPDGMVADLFLVSAATPDGPALFAVLGDAAGLSRTAHATVDRTRGLARIDFASTPAWLLEMGTHALEEALDHGRAALAAEQAGGAQHCLEMAVEYAKSRHQFGRPIGSFQAIKHHAADMLVAVESARSAAYYASLAPQEDPSRLSIAATTAQVCCSQAYTHVAAETIQIHGGIGFTWEHDAHLYYKRAKSDEVLLGGPDWHRDRLARLIGIVEEDTDD
ncbi:acyl-CoA dehydrogenase [Actinomadura sp. KC345]|uniref:acyl-CoA dehydrogenase family protein n=1 Tax=Actinomadura sp. KC345 TaxID=2530371 RepID=UPI001048412E|nr:acyl-CoA dehydrogenase family protein [Actinomadura sp. KC345]TDC55941.1 acyl-CoA dehydrogenase [Actinomadura sp. KC345]